ncbi:MAG: 2OG-Fe(II) oxygenase [Euryarchaeota archaeon]|nr:2OG-Fe(II) oxygenase [Euryarchaeota archaeon]OUU06253.1 MAG: 2OG-Fe(II) oxygenase [Gammaproteobacteria bacterium TMED34]
MGNFLFKEEQDISNDFNKNGYVIKSINNINSLDYIKNKIIKIIKKKINLKKKFNDNYLLNNIHKFVKVKDLNNFRLAVINDINSDNLFRSHYYKISRPYLDHIVGNELAMQIKINLSIQFPNDDSSLLATHADTWSGDSPYEAVVWLPLVNCYKTKAMYLLPPKETKKILENFSKRKLDNSEKLYRNIKKKVKWIDINYGEVLIFDQAMPHGNRVNIEKETRWSFNCRFKSLFSPYGDKKIGEFFQPITMKPITKKAISFKFPK